MLKALIFDVDGTMADTERDGHRVAFNQAFQAAGLNWSWDEKLYGELLAVTGGKERMRFYAEQYDTPFLAQSDVVEVIKTLHASKTEFYVQLLNEGKIPLRPGVERLINEARETGITLAISTTTTPANVKALLENTLGPESLDWFSVIAAGDIVPAKKPAPDIYTFALEKLGLDAADCLAFEDSRNGVLSSLAANLVTIITVNGYTQNDDFDGAVVVLDQLGEPDAHYQILAGNLDAQWVSMEALHQLV